MEMSHRQIEFSFLILVLLMLPLMANTQGSVYTIMAGPSMSTQTVNGFEKDPFFRLHFQAQMESTSELSPNALYLRLGYHTKGSAVNISDYVDDGGNEIEGSSSSMEFHNLSTSVGVKQRKEVGTNFLSYGFGIRGDFNLSTDFDPFFQALEGTENNFTYGLNFEVGWEFTLSELVSTTIEVGFYPDLSNQIYIPFQDTGYDLNGQPYFIQESDIKNVVFEARAGFRFWRKVIYTD